MNRRLSLLLFLLLFQATLAPPPTFARQFNKLETANLRLIYIGKSYEYIVPHVTACFENAYRFHHKLFDYRSREKVTVFLEDFGDFASGGAGPFPHNFVSAGLAPFNYVYESMTANDRINLIMNHELAHIATMDRAAPADRFYRSLFRGKVAPTETNPLSMLYSNLTNPRAFTPRWFVEGSAVFLETWMGGGLGRGFSSYDEMVFRTMVHDSAYFYDVVGLESEGTKVDFQVGANSYLYGTRIMSYLALQHGPEKLMQWVRRGEDSKRSFAGQFERVFGASLDDEWSRWIQWELQWQRANLDTIRQYPLTPFRPLLQKTLGSASRAFYNGANRELYVALRYPGQPAQIAAIGIDHGRLRKICEVPGAALFYVTSLAYDPEAGSLFFTSNNNKWRDLHVVNAATGEKRKLIEDARTGDLAFNPVDKSLWGVRHYLGLSTIVRIPAPYSEWNQVLSWPYGQDVFDIDVSPDGSILTAALALVDGTQKLIKMSIDSLMLGSKAYEVLFDFENSTPANFSFTASGTHLLGSSYYSGVSNIYRYDLAAGQMDILSNSETGFFRPVPVSTDSLVVMRYTAKGFVPVLIPLQLPENVAAIRFLGNEVVNAHPVVKTWLLKPPSSINLDSLTSFRGDYNVLGNLRFRSVYPVVEGYKDAPAFGLRLNFLDDIALAGLNITTSYSPDRDLPSDERLHAAMEFNYWRWRAHATYNGADFYDLFGPTKKSRRGYSLGLDYTKSLLYTGNATLDYEVGVTGYGNLERLPQFQNIAASFDRLVAGNARLKYRAVHKSLGAVDEEYGTKWQLAFQSNYVNRKLFPRLHADLDHGILLPLNHSSIWFRTSAGISGGDRTDPFANFYFGGFGNNWVDYQDEKRYREYYSFPGTELNAVGGSNYGKLMMEWDLPPVRFRRFGSMFMYLTWLRPALFVSGIVTNMDSSPIRRKLLNVGAQVDFELVLFARLPSTLSIGFAVAAEQDRLPSNEFMVSLKIL